jgi:hypothetical protein
MPSNPLADKLYPNTEDDKEGRKCLGKHVEMIVKWRIGQESKQRLSVWSINDSLNI